jgi:hypothetical protein
MIRLANSLTAWGRDDFFQVLRAEIEALPHEALPLQEGLHHSSRVSEEPFQAITIRADETADQIVAVASLFYSGVVADCSCADDPSPVDTLTENCMLEIRLNKLDATASFSLVEDDKE